MRPRSQLRKSQVRAIEFTTQHEASMLWLDMSLGKTAITLTTIADLIDQCQCWGALVLAPRRVAETVWAQEARLWAHLRWLNICVLRGRKKTLLARDLFREQAHIYVANYEMIPWLSTQMNELFLGRGRHLPFNLIVFDEISRVKNATGARIKALEPFLHRFPRRVGLTGTPASNGYLDLHGQYLRLDDGARLGVSKRAYTEQFFVYPKGDAQARPVLAKGAKEQIHHLIQDCTLSMAAEDYVDLPDYVYNDLFVDLDPKSRAEYNRLEQLMWAEFDSGQLRVFNAAALTMKCRQLANGYVLDQDAPAGGHAVHDRKLEAMDEVLEEAAGQPVLCVYTFVADMRRIRERYEKRGYQVSYIGPGVTDAQAIKIIDQWNLGNIQLLLGHPWSIGHGLNLQYGGHQIVWFGLDWNLELWDQANARLRRPGQPSPFVVVHRILARDTIDLAVRDALTRKAADQRGLRDAIKRYRAGLLVD